MADRYAPALFLGVLAFWFVLRWLLFRWLILFIAWALVLMMVIGALGTLAEHDYMWAANFAGSALLAWVLLRRWRGLRAPGRLNLRLPAFRPWRGKSADEVAMLCERRIGLQVDAAAPAIVSSEPPVRCVFALAGDGLWVLDDESQLRHPQIGRVMACWDRSRLVAHVEHHDRAEHFELSWPRQGALVRGVMPSGAPADQLAGQLMADELTRS